VIANTNSVPTVGTANLSQYLPTKNTAGANRASQAAPVETGTAAEEIRLNGTDQSAASGSDTAGSFPDAAAAEQGMAFARQSMQTQPATTLLAQANVSPASVLKLLG
jgi:hypothetical protein